MQLNYKFQKEGIFFMLKTLAKHIKEYKLPSIVTPIFMIGEVIMEMIIPLMMASIVNDGIEAGNTAHVYKVGILMIIATLFSLLFGIGGGKYSAKASIGFGKNLRKAMFEKIQTYSFANIDKFSTSSLVTRLTTDVTNMKNSYQMLLRMCMRAPACLIIAMIMSFSINAKLASIYLVAVIFLVVILFMFSKM
jgi:ATP-binding cassette subfamily B protein